MAAVETSPGRETDLVKTLKQIIESRTSSRSVTLFGKKVSVAKTEDEVQLSEKLPPTALVQLKGLYQQHLKRKAHRSDAVATLPLLNGIEDKEDGRRVGVKRQRLGPDQNPGSQPALSATSLQEVRAGPSFEQVEDRTEVSTKGAPLTVFYNGMVYVYDDISTDKAQAIMVLAESASSSISRTNSIDKLPSEATSPPQETQSAGPSTSSKRKFTLADLPQARKASLQRFLEKRKDRLIVTVPKKSFGGASPVKNAPKLQLAQPSVAPAVQIQ